MWSLCVISNQMYLCRSTSTDQNFMKKDIVESAYCDQFSAFMFYVYRSGYCLTFHRLCVIVYELYNRSLFELDI